MIFVSELGGLTRTMRRFVIHIRGLPRFRNSGNVEMRGHIGIKTSLHGSVFCDLRENNRNLPVEFASWPDGNLHVMAERNQEVH
jgi:hypothetical protein